MKRIIVIFFLLLICVTVSAYVIHHTGQVNAFISASVTRALDAMEAGERHALEREIESLCAFWGEEEDYLIHFVRHAQIDDVTKSVARLQALAAGEDYTELAAELASIRWQMEHIDRSERLLFSNLF